MGAAADILERVHRGIKSAAEDILMPVYQKMDDRTTPEQRAKNRADSETYRKADDEFQAQKESYSKRKAQEKGE